MSHAFLRAQVGVGSAEQLMEQAKKFSLAGLPRLFIWLSVGFSWVGFPCGVFETGFLRFQCGFFHAVFLGCLRFSSVFLGVLRFQVGFSMRFSSAFFGFFGFPRSSPVSGGVFSMRFSSAFFWLSSAVFGFLRLHGGF